MALPVYLFLSFAFWLGAAVVTGRSIAVEMPLEPGKRQWLTHYLPCALMVAMAFWSFLLFDESMGLHHILF